MASASFATMKVLRDPVDTSQDGVDIVLVPGIGTISPEKWPFANEEWLTTLPGSGSGARILAYEYLGTEPSWESVLMLGYDFIQQLSDVRSQSEPDVTTKPILIVSHSLGGVIVKQALYVANKLFYRYGSLFDAVAGVIFLSTPHRYGDNITSAMRFQDIFEAMTSSKMQTTDATQEQQGAILLGLADRFERISFRTPILSVYELKESITRPQQKYQQLVTRESCSTHTPIETVIGLNLDHEETCLFTENLGDEGLPEFTKFLHEALLDAVNLVALRLEQYQYATMTGSPTSDSAQNVEQISLTGPSNKALEGTSLSEFELVPPITPKSDIAKPIHLPCFLLNTHSANKDFCGREDILERLATELLPSEDTVTAPDSKLKQFALCGLGGIGKTEIAREFARHHQSSFDAVFWVVADEIAKLDHHYQQISLALGLEDLSECKSQVVSREIVKRWLSNPRKHIPGSDDSVQPGEASAEATWLLIFDNADNPMILTDYWPQGNGSILVTSRDPSSKGLFTRRPSGLDLGPLLPKDSLSLFNHLITIPNEPEADMARQVSDALGGIPLAIAQIAGIICREDLTLSEFLELYTDHEERASLYETKLETHSVTYGHSLSTVWAFGKLKPGTQQLLELISFLDPDGIGEDLLEATVELLSDGAPSKKNRYVEARNDLLQSSLVQRDIQKQQISVHRIVQDVILATMDDGRKRYLFDRVVRILWADWPSAMPKPSKEPELPQPKSSGNRLYVGRWPTCAAIYPHVLRIHQLWPTISDSSEATKLLFAKLLTDAAWYQKERGRTRQFDGFFETARSICESSTHPDRDSLLADIHFCLGSIAMDTNDFDTSRIHKECSFDLVSQICKDLGLADDRLYLAYAERGISRIQDRRYDEGEADLKEALRIRKALGNYIPRSGEANLSWALLLQGKLEECNTLLLDSLAGRENTLGKNDREDVRTGLILYALGNLRAAQNQWDESFQYHRRAWHHMRETVGERDLYTANITHKIAEHLVRSGHNEEAIVRINGALEIWSVDPNAHKNEIARTTFLKGNLLAAMGKRQKASIAFRVACRLRKEITKEDRDLKSLTMEDFDDIVAFWAR